MAVIPATDTFPDASRLPDVAEPRWEQLITRVGFLASGVLLLNMALRSWAIGQIGSHHGIVWLVFIEYGLAFSLLAIGVMTADRMRGLVPLIALAILFAFCVWAYIQINIAFTLYGTDNAALSHVAAEKLLDGENPYSVHDQKVVENAAERFGVPETFITSTTDGEPLSNLMSWPAGSVLVLTPPIAFGLHDVRWVVVVFQIVTFALLWFRAPAVFRPIAGLALAVDPDLFVNFTGGGVMDYIWVAPMVACAIALYARRLGSAALLYGLAAGTKQPPWLLAPFLLIWVWQTQDEDRRLSAVAQFAAVAAAAFLTLNLPFMVWDFHGWITGTLLPLRESMVPFGSGISLLTQAGIIDLPKSFYSAATFGVWGVLIVTYTVHFRTLRHALWLMPAIIMWFGYRSLQNYFVYWSPVALVALMAWWEEEQVPEPVVELHA